LSLFAENFPGRKTQRGLNLVIPKRGLKKGEGAAIPRVVKHVPLSKGKHEEGLVYPADGGTGLQEGIGEGPGMRGSHKM